MPQPSILNTLDNISPRLISELRRMAEERMDPNVMDDPSLDFDPQSDRDSRAAMKILAGIPMAGGIMTGPETILSLVRDPKNEKNKEYIRENRALLRAFPILKQIYGIEKEVNPLDWDGNDKKTKERNLAVEDFIKMFGKDSLPQEFRPSSLEDINKRISELDKIIPEEEEWFKTARTSPLEADAETVKHIENQEKLQKEIDKLAGSPYVQDALTDSSTDTEPDFRIEAGPMDADAEALKHIRLQEESDKLKRGYETTPTSLVGQGSAINAEEQSQINEWLMRSRERERNITPEQRRERKRLHREYWGKIFADAEARGRRLQEESDKKKGRRGAKGYIDRVSTREREAQIGADELEVDADKAEDAYELPETDLESGRNMYTIEKDIAITEALEAADYDKVKRIEDAYKKHEPIPTDDTDDWSYMGKAMHRYQEGGVVGYAHGGSAEEQLTKPVIPHPDVTLDTALPTENMGFVGTPNGAADDQTEAAKNGEMGGDKVDENLPEGSFVLNSYAVELAGIKDIEKLIDDAKKYILVQTGESGFVSPVGEDVEVRVSEGEYIIPPALVRIIGRDRLEKINNRGIVEFERQQAEETEMGGEEMPQEPRGYMPQEEAAPLPQQEAAPMPQQEAEPMLQQEAAPMPQGFAVGGVSQNIPKAVSQDSTKVDVYQFLNALAPVLNPVSDKEAKPATAPKQRVAQAPQPKAVQQTRTPIGRQPPSPLARVNPLAPGVPNLQKKPNIRMANMGGFMPYSRNV